MKPGRHQAEKSGLDRVLAANRIEYEICQRRGHSASNVTLTVDPPIYICQYCQQKYQLRSTDQIELGFT